MWGVVGSQESVVGSEQAIVNGGAAPAEGWQAFKKETLPWKREGCKPKPTAYEKIFIVRA
jgi:hypothetical protein